MAGAGQVTVEFYGIPRERAGRAEIALPAGTLHDLLRAIQAVCPRLTGLLADDGLAPHYLLSVNGERFVRDLGEPLRAGDRVLLLSADVGG